MASQDLITGIRSLLGGLITFIEIGSSESNALIADLAARFISDPNNVWWWQSLLLKPRIVAYGNSDGLSVLSSYIHDIENVYLVATDDEPPPLPVFRGQFHEIRNVIGEQPFFEYFVAAESRKRIIFDTHHNSLYICGDFESSKRSPDEKFT